LPLGWVVNVASIAATAAVRGWRDGPCAASTPEVAPEI